MRRLCTAVRVHYIRVKASTEQIILDYIAMSACLVAGTISAGGKYNENGFLPRFTKF
jgi:hypothetical protein